MACGAVSMAILAFLALALLLCFSVPTVACNNSSPSALIISVCNTSITHYGQMDLKVCIETLASQPRVVEAKDSRSILIALLEVGISNATDTRSYMQKKLKEPGLKPDYIYVLQHCDSGYDAFVSSFKMALSDVKDYNDYNAASYDIKIAFTDNMNQCLNALSSKKVKDVEISRGNNLTNVCGQVAFDTANNLLPNHP